MLLYHFCNGKDYRSIKRKGITLGAIVRPELGTPIRILAGWQWLTTDSDKDHQTWNTNVLLPYDRTEYRLTVDIPERWEDCLYDQDRLRASLPWIDYLFDGWDGSENWRVFHGPINVRWIVKAEHWNKETQQYEAVETGKRF